MKQASSCPDIDRTEMLLEAGEAADTPAYVHVPLRTGSQHAPNSTLLALMTEKQLGWMRSMQTCSRELGSASCSYLHSLAVLITQVFIMSKRGAMAADGSPALIQNMLIPGVGR